MKSIEGDLLEVYNARVIQSGRRKANLKFAIHVLQLFRPSVIRPLKLTANINLFNMYSNYIIIAWRNLIKNKAFSAINISGLSLGITCSILIGLWVNDELNMDSFHQDIDRIYTVTSVEYSGTEVNGSFDTPGLLAEELTKVFPEVEFATSKAWTQWHTFAVNDKRLKVPGNFSGEDFFKMFSHPLIVGDRNNVLKGPESIVISRKMAVSFFGSPEASVDKTLRFENYKDLKITGVFEDMGDNVSDKMEYVICWQLEIERNSWLKDFGNSGPTTYLKLKEHADAKDLESKLQHFLKKYSKNYTDLERLELGLQPYSDTYLHSNFKNGKISGGRIEYVNLFRIIAIFILLIACINFMNLSTARAVKRAKEIGVRKAIGALRFTLMTQFTIEAFMFTFIAVFLALGLLNLLLPSFNLLTGKNINSPLTNRSFWIGLGLLTLITGFLSGSYPAIVLSSFKPATVLKSNVKLSASSGFFRRALVVFQFALSMIFIIGMIVVSKQVDYIQNKNIGFQRNNLIFSSITGSVADRFETYKQEALNQSGIIDVTRTSQRPIEIGNSTADVEWEGKDPSSKPTFTNVEVGYDFIRTMRSALVLGRDFSTQYNDSSNFIINETAMKVMGYKDPIGMPLRMWDIKGTIVGVVKDFHFNTLHQPIDPLLMRLGREKMWGWLLIRIDPQHASEAIASIEKLHNKYSSDTPFSYQFADEEYDYLYRSEQVVKQLSRYFAGLAIFISSLGLLGLVIFTAEQRTKEVSIRKILGASAPQIVALLSRDFMTLVCVASIISFPAAYYVSRQWLGAFEYHINIEWWMFLVAGVGALSVALVTVLIQGIKTATSNPVDSLKSE